MQTPETKNSNNKNIFIEFETEDPKTAARVRNMAEFRCEDDYGNIMVDEEFRELVPKRVKLELNTDIFQRTENSNIYADEDFKQQYKIYARNVIERTIQKAAVSVMRNSATHPAESTFSEEEMSVIKRYLSRIDLVARVVSFG